MYAERFEMFKKSKFNIYYCIDKRVHFNGVDFFPTCVDCFPICVDFFPICVDFFPNVSSNRETHIPSHFGFQFSHHAGRTSRENNTSPLGPCATWCYHTPPPPQTSRCFGEIFRVPRLCRLGKTKATRQTETNRSKLHYYLL